MKALLLFAIVSSSAFANTNPALEQDMKQIGGLFGEIAKSMNDASKNAQNAADAAAMMAPFTDALNQVPNTIDTAPADQQAQLLSDYKAWIQDEINLCPDLQSAFLKGDNAGAVVILQKMNQIKNQGHGKFKPPQP